MPAARRPYPSKLTDAEWAVLEPLLPQRTGRGRPPKWPRRVIADAIRIMSPDADPEAIRPKKPSRKGCDWFGRGELARMVLDVLREAQGPLGHAEIALANGAQGAAGG